MTLLSSVEVTKFSATATLTFCAIAGLVLAKVMRTMRVIGTGWTVRPPMMVPATFACSASIASAVRAMPSAAGSGASGWLRRRPAHTVVGRGCTSAARSAGSMCFATRSASERLFSSSYCVWKKNGSRENSSDPFCCLLLRTLGACWSIWIVVAASKTGAVR